MLAAAAVLALAALAPEATRLALRQPVVWVLFAYALVTAASAAWTVGDTADAVRWAAVVAGYGGVAIAGFVVARSAGAEVVGWTVLGLAVACGLAGLFGAAARVEPLAERIGGAWRPGGPLEYPPALGALMIAAAPPALRLMLAGGRRAAVGAGALTVASATVALISSRAVLALAAVLLVALVVFAPALGIRRSLALAAAAFAVTAGAAADAVAGSYAEPYVVDGDAPRLVGLAALLVVAGLLWPAVRACWEDGTLNPERRARAIILTLVPLAVAVAAAIATPDMGEAVEPDSGITHGRLDTWEAAIDAATERPLEGSGALTFLAVSGPLQDPPPTRFAHDLVLESWVELGLAGLGLAMALVAITLVLLARGVRAGGLLLVPGAAAFLVAMLIDWPWHVPAAAGTFALLLGGLAAVDALGRVDTGPRRT